METKSKHEVMLDLARIRDSLLVKEQQIKELKKQIEAAKKAATQAEQIIKEKEETEDFLIQSVNDALKKLGI